MKKLKLFSLGLLGASLFLTSCGEDDPAESEVGPSLTVTETTVGITDGEVEVVVGEDVYFQWEARKGTSDLDDFTIERDGFGITGTTVAGNDLPYSISNANDELYIDSYTFTTVDEGSNTFDFIVTDKNGLTKTETVVVNVIAEATPLSSASTFSWERQGGAAGTGLAPFGLKWTQNSGGFAIITEDAATRLVELDAAAWTDITSVEDLEDAVESASVLTDGYRGVSTNASATYDDVLGVRYNDVYYMIHVTQANVSSSSAGTDITISGQYKN